MRIRVREQSGTDTIRKFDYQLAVALSYLLENIYDENTIVIIESLEDFAVLKGLDSSSRVVDVYQVKTKDHGNYTKSLLSEDDVIGKIFLTDYLFESHSQSLNIICNQNINLFGKTLEFDDFKFANVLDKKELEELSNEALRYLKDNSDFKEDNVDVFLGKLVYIKTVIPFHHTQTPYDDMLSGISSRAINSYLGNPNNTINANAIYEACKLLMLQKTKYRLQYGRDYSLDDLIAQKGICVKEIHRIINDSATRNELEKKDYLDKASVFFSPKDFVEIKEYFPVFLSKKDDLSDSLFQSAYICLRKIYREKAKASRDINELIKETCEAGFFALSNCDRPFIQLLSILIVFGS